VARVLPIPHYFSRGFWPATGLIGSERVPGSVIDGQNVLFLGPHLAQSAKGLGTTSGFVPGYRAFLVGDSIAFLASNTTGGMTKYRQNSIWWTSHATFNLGTTAFPSTGGTLKYMLGSATYKAGFPNPLGSTPAITLSASSADSSKMQGTYNLTYTKYRSWSGAESVAQEPPPAIAVDQKKIHLHIDADPTNTGETAYDTYKIYATQRGFGSTGPFYFLMDIPTSTGTVIDQDIEYSDFDLDGDIEPPTDHDPPPSCDYVVALGQVILAIGPDGIRPSIPGNPEAFPASYFIALNPPETIVGFAGRPTEGELYVWTNNSLQSIVLTGSESVPVLTRSIWPQLGIQSRHGGAFADLEFYCFSGQAGIIRLGIDSGADTAFATPVREYVRRQNWDPTQVMVGYDPTYDMVVYCHQTTALAYLRGLRHRTLFTNPYGEQFQGAMGGWMTPITLPAPITSLVTFNGRLYMSTASNVYIWETGNGGNWYFIPAWEDGAQLGDGFDYKTIYSYRVGIAGGTITADLLTDLDSSTAKHSFTDNGSGRRYTSWENVNIKAKSWTVKLSGSAAGDQVEDIRSRIIYEPMVRKK